jgi:hypothetical protein
VYYTGRPEFQVGTDIFWSKIAVATDGQNLDAIQFRLVTRLDF